MALPFTKIKNAADRNLSIERLQNLIQKYQQSVINLKISRPTQFSDYKKLNKLDAGGSIYFSSNCLAGAFGKSRQTELATSNLNTNEINQSTFAGFFPDTQLRAV